MLSKRDLNTSVYQYKEILENDAVYFCTKLANYTVLDDIKIDIDPRQRLRLHVLCITFKKTTNKLLGNVADFKYLLTAINIHIKNSGKACYIPFKIFHTLFFSLRVLRYGIKFFNSFVFAYGCKTWFLTLKRKHRLKVFGGQVLKNIRR
jgi:hypothetical protein